MGADLKITTIARVAYDRFWPSLEQAMHQAYATEPGSPDEEKVIEEIRRCWHLAREGQFRDSYNPTNVLRTLGMDWRDDVLPLLDEHGDLRGKRLVEFLQRVETTEQQFDSDEEMSSWGLPGLSWEYALRLRQGRQPEVTNAPDVWRVYFVEKRLELINFLRRAVEMGEGICCSL